MAESAIASLESGRPGRRRWRWVVGAGGSLLAAGLGACWWLNAPLEEPSRAAVPTSTAEALPDAPTAAPEGPPAWPDGTLDGMAAKKLLLDILVDVDERVRQVHGYTATFRKQERLNGVLGPEQTLAMKVRHRPFAVYFKFLDPSPGKEVVYAEGFHDNKVIAHATGVARLLLPRLVLAPDHPLALAETRHPITEAGLANLTAKLLAFRRLDMDDPDAETMLDRVDDRGRPRLRSIHTHSRRDRSRPFTRVEVLYDPETRIPVQIRNFDWPEPGDSGAPILAESYAYDDLDLNATLTPLDFDPANPDYAFHRY